MLKHLTLYTYISKNLKAKYTYLFQMQMLEFFHVLHYQNPRLSKPSTVHFPKSHFQKLRNFYHQTWPKVYPNFAFRFYMVFKRGSMESFSRYHFSIIEIVVFDNFKCIPCCYFLHNNRPFLVYLVKAPKHGRIG
jgi:hypothetical protein